MNCIPAKDCDVPTLLQLYLREITDDSLLTASEECSLAAAIARGDSEARSRMIQSNLRLVVRIARDYLGRGLQLDDLIGEGNLGLIRAAEEFDPRFGTRFSTYASYWIKQAIRHALINTTSTIRLPAHMVGLLTKWRRAERALCRQAGRVPSFDEIAQMLSLSETQKSLVAKALNARQLKLEGRIAEDNGHRPWEEAVGRNCSPESTLDTDDELKQLSRRMERLDDRERVILSLRYGLEGETPLTLKEIGRRLGVTREWVRKIELRAVRKLDERADALLKAGAGEAGARKPKRTAVGSSEGYASDAIGTEVSAPRPRRRGARYPVGQLSQSSQMAY
jgi:RNA polymerase primary sigma factor